MERPLEEKFSAAWRAMWLFACFPIALILITPLGALLIGRNVTDLILPMGMGLGVILLVMCSIRWLSRDQKNEWFLTDDGLVRVRSSGERTEINWDLIQGMRWTGFFGLIIRWDKPQSGRKGKIFYENVRTTVGFDARDAMELIALWNENKSASKKSGDAKAHPVRHQARAVRDGSAGKSAAQTGIIGFLALIMAIGSVFKGQWLFALATGLTAAASFTLTFWEIHPSVSKYRQPIRWALLLLVGALFFWMFELEKKMGLMGK